MTKLRLPYIKEYLDRHGKMRRYIRRRGLPKAILPGQPGSAEFMEAYQAALAGSVQRPSRHESGSMGALATEFFASAEFRNLKPASQSAYRAALDPVLSRDGHRLVRDLPADKARKIVQEIGATRPGMANLTRAVLRRMMKFAIGLNWRDSNPFDAVPNYRLGTHHTWTEDELKTFEAKWPLGTRERLAFDLLLWTGQRIGDVVRMQRGWIVDGAIHLTQQKTGAEVSIAIHPALARSLAASPVKGLQLIGDVHGRAISRSGLTQLMTRVIREAGLPEKCVPHGLRKAALRRLAEGGATVKQMQAVSGHRTLGEIERYTRQANQKQLAKDAIASLPDFQQERKKKRTPSV